MCHPYIETLRVHHTLIPPIFYDAYISLHFCFVILFHHFLYFDLSLALCLLLNVDLIFPLLHFIYLSIKKQIIA